jgi:SPP1 family predicted phage head-tail adaptor
MRNARRRNRGAGRLRKLVTIESCAQAQNGLGEMVDTWSTFATVYAGFEVRLPGREDLTAQQVKPVHPETIVIRYLAGVTSKMRVRYGTRVFSIQDLANTGERNEELVLDCVEQL